MIRVKINAEVGFVVILTAALTLAIFTVVGFDKAAKDLERIEKSVQENQRALSEGTKTVPKSR